MIRSKIARRRVRIGCGGRGGREGAKGRVGRKGRKGGKGRMGRREEMKGESQNVTSTSKPILAS